MPAFHWVTTIVGTTSMLIEFGNAKLKSFQIIEDIILGKYIRNSETLLNKVNMWAITSSLLSRWQLSCLRIVQNITTYIICKNNPC